MRRRSKDEYTQESEMIQTFMQDSHDRTRSDERICEATVEDDGDDIRGNHDFGPAG